MHWKLRGQLGCVGRVLRDLRRRDGDSRVCGVHASGCRRRAVLCDVRRGGQGHVASSVQHCGDVSRRLRGQLGCVGRLLCDVRRRQRRPHICGVDTGKFRRRSVLCDCEHRRQHYVQYGAVPNGLRGQLGCVGHLLCNMRQRDTVPHVWVVDTGEFRWRGVLYYCEHRRQRFVQHGAVPGGLRGQLGCVERVLSDVRRRDTVPRICGVDTGKFQRRGLLCDCERRRQHSVQHGRVSRGLRGQLGCMGRLLGYVWRRGTVPHVCGVDVGKFRRRGVLCDCERRRQRTVQHGAVPG